MQAPPPPCAPPPCRLGLQHGTTSENRRLALDLAMLLIGWDKHTNELEGAVPQEQKGACAACSVGWRQGGTLWCYWGGRLCVCE